MPEVTGFTDDAARAARQGENPVNPYLNGMNLGGSNACGIGINMEGGAVVGTPEQFTLLDQNGLVRDAQRSQQIGGFPFVPRTGNQEFTWDRSQPLYTLSGAMSSGGQSGTLPDAVIFTGVPSASGDGSAIKSGQAALQTLGAGWIIDPL